MDAFATLARLDAGVSWLRVLPAPDEQPGWVRCADLLGDPDRLTGWRREVADAYGDPITGDGLVLDWYAGALALPGAGLFHLDRRVPDLSPERVHLLVGPGGTVAGVAVDPTGGPDAPADPAALRRQLVAHAERLLEPYATDTRIGRHGLWGAVTDALDVAFLTAGWVSGESARAAADAALVLGTDGEPLVGPSTLHELADARGRTHWTRRRYSCCFLYRAPDGGTCVTCPRVTDDERRQQAVHW